MTDPLRLNFRRTRMHLSVAAMLYRWHPDKRGHQDKRGILLAMYDWFVADVAESLVHTSAKKI